MSSYKSEQKSEIDYTLASGADTGSNSPSVKSQQAESVKQLALSIKEYSIMARETLQAIRDSGVIPELATSIREVAVLIRDISAQAREASKELRESGIVNEAASSVRETVDSTKEIARELKDAAKTGHESSKTGKPAGVK